MLEGSSVRLLFDDDVLRRLWRGVWREPADFAVVVESDPERIELLEDPFSSVADVQDRLGQLEARLIARNDRRSVFLTVYTEMTAQTARAIDEGTFDDSVWMRRYLVRFAEYYRRAFEAFERGAFEDVPDPWLVAFGTALRGDALVAQDAFLGINAHILYDLALTLSDIGLDPEREVKYTDHRRIDGILGRLVRIQRELLAERYAPGLSRVGKHMQGFDERWSASTLRHARENAWRTAVVRSDAGWRFVETYTEWLLQRTATGSAFSLLQPTEDPSTMAVLRDIESDQFDLVSYARTFHERAGGGLSAARSP